MFLGPLQTKTIAQSFFYFWSSSTLVPSKLQESDWDPIWNTPCFLTPPQSFAFFLQNSIYFNTAISRKTRVLEGLSRIHFEKKWTLNQLVFLGWPVKSGKSGKSREFTEIRKKSGKVGNWRFFFLFWQKSRESQAYLSENYFQFLKWFYDFLNNFQINFVKIFINSFLVTNFKFKVPFTILHINYFQKNKFYY